MSSPEALREERRRHIVFRSRLPLVGLAARIGRFEPPFEYLRATKIGFRVADRYLLNRCIAGDADAIAARENGILFHVPSQISGADQKEAETAYNAYFHAHQLEIEALWRAEYPRPAYLAPVDDPNAPPYELGRKPRELTQWIDEAVFQTMAEYGFDRKRRKQSKSQWLCTATIAGSEVEIQFDKGGHSSMSGWLSVKEVGFFADLGQPFFFSQVRYSFNEGTAIRSRLRAFFIEYAKLFPHILVAIESGKAIRDAHLADDDELALRLARESLHLTA